MFNINDLVWVWILKWFVLFGPWLVSWMVILFVLSVLVHMASYH